MKTSFRILLTVVILALAGTAVLIFQHAPSDTSQPPAHDADPAYCIECHQDIVAKWNRSHHAEAQRPVEAGKDAPRFSFSELQAPGEKYRSFIDKEGIRIQTVDNREGSPVYEATHAFGYTPLVQYLFEAGDGRLQAWHMAWDVRSNEWFSVFEDEKRKPHEWGYWANRGMNWNFQCAYCHVTDFEKNYDLDKDRYDSTWSADGVTCLQCHNNLAGHAQHKEAVNPPREVSMETCATCHSRREHLTEDFRPGDNYHDHFRIALMNNEGVYQPDGQVIQENYVYGSFLSSKMGQKGVTCMDCHDPHSGELVLPADNNLLCLSCHAPPGKNGAVAINPLDHSRHKPESTGYTCIECHMPVNYFMARDGRRDHAFTSPDPVLNRDLGVPDACSSCHADKPLDWTIEHFEEWYPNAKNRRVRHRAMAVQKGFDSLPAAGNDLGWFASTESNDFWRATLNMMLGPWAAQQQVFTHLSSDLRHSNELVRAAAVDALSQVSASELSLRTMLSDPVRLVRTRAALALAGSLDPGSQAFIDTQAYLEYNADQPVGSMQLGQWHAAMDNLEEGLKYLDRAAAWDPVPGGFLYTKGLMLHRAGRLEEALKAFSQASGREPNNAEFYYGAALLLAESGRLTDAIPTLKKTVECAPDFDRAWYNLGLAYAQDEQLAEAAAALETAEEKNALSPDYPYALATIYLRQNSRQEAEAALRRCLNGSPLRKGAWPPL